MLQSLDDCMHILCVRFFLAECSIATAAAAAAAATATAVPAAAGAPAARRPSSTAGIECTAHAVPVQHSVQSTGATAATIYT